MIEPARAAFLLIDMQNGFIDGASPLCIAGAAATVPACAHALAAAREHGLAVFHVRRAYAADGMEYAAAGVDTDNPSGAVDLYESLGYVPTRGTILYALDV